MKASEDVLKIFHFAVVPMGLPLFFMKRNIIIGALLLIIGFVIGILCRPDHFREVTKMSQTDTIWRFDTIRIVSPPETKREILTERIEVVVNDTVRIHDTLYMSLPIQKRTYKGDDYYAEVAGYEPRLTFIEVYPKNVVISKTETTTQEKPFAFSLDVGLDMGKGVQTHISPNLSAAIGIKRLSIVGELGVNLDAQENMLLAPSLYYEFGLRWSLIK